MTQIEMMKGDWTISAKFQRFFGSGINQNGNTWIVFIYENA
jgi:hypothetical protein